mmetsp:Transcript_69740/g.119775  ORF Transcript_69740/g.119775 Transcript_69740/m.119775 type:complete len:204 (+) Transcript_69740:43-654(+)
MVVGVLLEAPVHRPRSSRETAHAGRHHARVPHQHRADLRRLPLGGRHSFSRGRPRRTDGRHHVPRALRVHAKVRTDVQALLRPQVVYRRVGTFRRKTHSQRQLPGLQQGGAGRDFGGHYGQRVDPRGPRNVEAAAPRHRAGVPQEVAQCHGRPLWHLHGNTRQGPRSPGCGWGRRQAKSGGHGGTVRKPRPRHHRESGVQLRL